jgi:hypothetical protein
MLYDDWIFENSVWHFVYKICGFILVTQLATMICVEGVFMPRKFKEIARILNYLDNEIAHLSLSDQSLDGICCGCRPAE